MFLHTAERPLLPFPARLGLDHWPRLEIGSGAAGRSLEGQHDRADLVILVGAFDRPLGLAVEWRTPRVAPLLLVIGDDRDGPTLFVADMFEIGRVSCRERVVT